MARKEGDGAQAEWELSDAMRRSIAQYHRRLRIVTVAATAARRRRCAICDGPAWELPDGTTTATCHSHACMAQWLGYATTDDAD